MEPPYTIELLGGLKVWLGDRCITRFRTQKAASLLAYLAFHLDRAHPREVLAEILWPERAPSSARDNLRVSLASLRRQLEPPGIAAGTLLVADRLSIGLNPEAVTTDVGQFEAATSLAGRTVPGRRPRVPPRGSRPPAQPDADEVERLTSALELYRGELLPGFYEEWVLPEQQRLAALYFQALRRLSAALESRGDLPRALEYARRAVTNDPLSEAAQRDMIRILAAGGDPGLALRQYEELERILAEDQDRRPGPDTRELALRIRAEKSRPAVTATAPARPRPASSRPPAPSLRKQHSAEAQRLLAPDGCLSRPAGRLPLQLTRFFGRTEELRWLQQFLAPRTGEDRQLTPFAAARRGSTGVFDLSPSRPSRPACGDGRARHRPPPEAPASPARLATLTGPGGSGKTRLAIEAAKLLDDSYRGAVWFVALAELSDPRQIPQAVVEALCPAAPTRRAPVREPLQQAAAILACQPSLLVLDNVEHLLEAPVNGDPAAAVVKQLLADAPDLVCLATSRRTLGLEGERELAVAPLPVPDPLAQAGSWTSPSEAPASRGPSQPLGPMAAGGTLWVPLAGRGTPGRDLAELAVNPSVQLFIDRAQAARPDFQLTVSNCRAVAELCRRLEGIPLALQLAAARVRVLSPAQMLEHLPRRFRFLVNRRQRAHAQRAPASEEARHATLWTAFDWSYRLLSPELQRLFVELSVFRGGWTLEAAAAVCLWDGDGPDSSCRESARPRRSSPVAFAQGTPASAPACGAGPGLPESRALDLLEELRAGSLVLAEESKAAPERMRFRMLETLREYAGERVGHLDLGAAALGLQRRHGLFFLAFAERAAQEYRGPGEGEWLTRLDEEHENLRAALRWSTTRLDGSLALPPAQGGGLPAPEAPGAAEIGLRLCAALFRFWHLRGHVPEGRQWVEALLPAAGDAPPLCQAEALKAASCLAGEESAVRDLERAVLLCQESLEIYRSLGRQDGVAGCLFNLGQMVLAGRDRAAAAEYHRQALDIRRAIGDSPGIAQSLHRLGRIATARGDLAAAEGCFQESLAVAREAHYVVGAANCLTGLSYLAVQRGDMEAALALLEEDLALHRSLGETPDAADALQLLGRAHLRAGDSLRARQALGESIRIYHATGHLSGIIFALTELGTVAHETDCPVDAVRLLAAAAALERSHGFPGRIDDPQDAAPRLSDLRARLGKQAFTAAWEAGTALPLQQAVADALRWAAAGR